MYRATLPTLAASASRSCLNTLPRRGAGNFLRNIYASLDLSKASRRSRGDAYLNQPSGGDSVTRTYRLDTCQEFTGCWADALKNVTGSSPSPVIHSGDLRREGYVQSPENSRGSCRQVSDTRPAGAAGIAKRHDRVS